MLTPGDIRTRVRKSPFVPFRIVTSSGESYEVWHPRLIMIGTREITIGTPTKKDPAIYDELHRLMLAEITMLEDISDA